MKKRMPAASDSAIEQKINELLGKMTPEEKAGQLHQTHKSCCSYEDMMAMVRKGRVGSILLWGMPTGRADDERENAVNEIQRIAVEESRLGIPILFGLDVIHGLRTVFPIPLGLAAGWSRDAALATASIAAAETASAGIRWTFTPMVDISRDPRWGRIAESFGEDPYLCSELAFAAVRGYQGEKLGAPDKIAACVKHFAGYGAAVGGRDHTNSNISERALRDIYLPNFRAAVKAGVATVMTAFNDIDGIPCTASKYLLKDVLREEWGFDGFVVTDFQCIDYLRLQGIAADKAEAAEMAIKSGVDMDMVSGCFSDHLVQLVVKGIVPVEELDRAVRNVLRIKFRVGLFERPYADFNLADKIILCENHKKVALEAAEKSLVLLRNENHLLPLSPDIKRIAVMGPLSESRSELLGCWNPAGRGEDVITVAEGVKSVVSPETTVFTGGGGFEDTLLTTSSKADAVILVVGEHPLRSGEGRDITSLTLPAGQEELIRRVHNCGIPVVLVVMAGRQLDLSWAAEHIPAIVYAWHPGTMGGQAIANVLFGKVNPSGKTPVTFPRATGQIPLYYNCKRNVFGHPSNMQNYLEIARQGPLFPFGFGLSYTSFDYSNLSISPDTMTGNSGIVIAADITNAGEADGDEVVQLYVKDCIASVNRPVKELKGFDRVYLKRGETKTVKFKLNEADLAFTRSDMSWGSEPGEFIIWVGPDSERGLQGSFVLK